jgi:hypothetical protein
MDFMIKPAHVVWIATHTGLWCGAIVPRACAENEAALSVLKALSIVPARSVALSLFRRRQPLSRRKELPRRRP